MNTLPVILILAIFMALATGGCQQESNKQIVYKAGDVVKLKSGGPDMVVEYDVYGDNNVYVQWQDNLGQPQFRMYRQTTVESAK